MTSVPNPPGDTPVMTTTKRLHQNVQDILFTKALTILPLNVILEVASHLFSCTF